MPRRHLAWLAPLLAVSFPLHVHAQILDAARSSGPSSTAESDAREHARRAEELGQQAFALKSRDPARAGALYMEAGAEAGHVLASQPESEVTRTKRVNTCNMALSSYREAATLASEKAPAIKAAIALADVYLRALHETYGPRAAEMPEFKAIAAQRAEFETQRAELEPAALIPPVSGGAPPMPPTDPLDAPAPPASPNPSRSLRTGLGVSLAVTGAASIALFSTMGLLIKSHNNAIGRDVSDEYREHHDRLRAGYFVAAAFVGVGLVSTAVFTGLIVRQRRARPSAFSWSAGPARGGAMVFTSFRF